MGYVYFFGIDDAIKVGFTTDVRRRLLNVQSHHRNPVELVAVVPGTVEDEKAWHGRLADYHVRGEWFALCAGSRRLLDGLPTVMPESPAKDGGASFGRYLSAALQRAGLKQAAMARLLGVNPASVSDWISGRYRPSRDNFAAIAACIGRPVDEVAAAVAS